MRQRRGFTLVEILVALVVLGVVTGAIYKLLHTTQRLSLAQAEQVDLQANVRTGSLVVPNELRELNTWTGGTADRNDVITPDADGIVYRAMRGLGFACQAAAAGAFELRLASSSWTGLRAPSPGRDNLYVFIDGDPNDAGDDQWGQVALTGVNVSGNACGGAAGMTLTTAALPAAVPVNTPVRLFEVMELRLYQSGGRQWLGARSVSAGENIQPVIGPLTDDGFELAYLNSVGAPTVDNTAIKSIRVTVRGLTDQAVRAHGSGALGHPEEALTTQVLLRNSIRP